MSAVWVKSVYRLLSAQIVTGIILVLGAAVVNKPAALSVMLGCLITLIPNIFLAFYVFRPHATVRAFYIGEMGKLALVVILMATFLHFFTVQLMPLMVGFLGTYLIYWMAPIILRKS